MEGLLSNKPINGLLQLMLGEITLFILDKSGSALFARKDRKNLRG